jgi:hypothetical protein
MRQKASRYHLTSRCFHLHPYFVERVRPDPVTYQLRLAFSAPRRMRRQMQWVDDRGHSWTISWHRKGNITSGVSIACPESAYEIAIDDSTWWIVGVKTDCTFLVVTPERQTSARFRAGFLGSRHVLEVESRTAAVGIYQRCRCHYPVVVRRTCPFDERICIALYLAILHWPHSPRTR